MTDPTKLFTTLHNISDKFRVLAAELDLCVIQARNLSASVNEFREMLGLSDTSRSTDQLKRNALAAEERLAAVERMTTRKDEVTQF